MPSPFELNGRLEPTRAPAALRQQVGVPSPRPSPVHTSLQTGATATSALPGLPITQRWWSTGKSVLCLDSYGFKDVEDHPVEGVDVSWKGTMQSIYGSTLKLNAYVPGTYNLVSSLHALVASPCSRALAPTPAPHPHPHPAPAPAAPGRPFGRAGLFGGRAGAGVVDRHHVELVAALGIEEIA
jgi:hypothetical protein